MIEGLPGSSTPKDPDEIERFLDDFNQKCVEFGYYCDQYMREEINIGDITRHFSAATADAEAYFAENSFSMNMEQLQRYGVIQKTLDNMTTELFETEIKRNREVVYEALKNGEYFITGLTYNSIKSSIYMMYSKQKIKTEQNERLGALEAEQEATQGMIKVLKAVGSTVQIDSPEQMDFQRIQKAFEIYINYFRNASNIATKPYADERLFRLLGEHVEFLKKHDFAGDKPSAVVHLSICCDTLQPLAQTDDQRQRLNDWRQL